MSNSGNDDVAPPFNFWVEGRFGRRVRSVNRYAEQVSTGIYASAMTAIEIFIPLGAAGNLAPWRAGGSDMNHLSHSSFIPREVTLVSKKEGYADDFIKRTSGGGENR